MPVTTSPYAEAADALKAIIDAEYLPEGWAAIHDALHPGVGMDTGTRIGIEPDRETSAGVSNEILILVKFYRRWDPDVDMGKKIDPRPITVLAERFRDALRRANDLGTGRVWFWNLVEIAYPSDPTGNKTRFEARLVAFGNNTALVETVS